jgi:SAM-dependent methyltransferase
MSDYEWLITHHNAKIEERRNFSKEIIPKTPKVIMDLGCGFGLWLKLIDEVAHKESILIGVDNDENSLNKARSLSSKFKCQFNYLKYDIEKDVESLPKADIILMINMYGYIKEIKSYTEKLLTRLNKNGILVIRQYDGSIFKFGPMGVSERLTIEMSLSKYISDYSHYTVDKLLSTAHDIKCEIIEKRFDLVQRKAPFKNEFKKYFYNELHWIMQRVSLESLNIIHDWQLNTSESEIYFFETELIMKLQNQ